LLRARRERPRRRAAEQRNELTALRDGKISHRTARRLTHPNFLHHPHALP